MNFLMRNRYYSIPGGFVIGILLGLISGSTSTPVMTESRSIATSQQEIDRIRYEEVCKEIYDIPQNIDGYIAIGRCVQEEFHQAENRALIRELIEVQKLIHEKL